MYLIHIALLLSIMYRIHIGSPLFIMYLIHIGTDEEPSYGANIPATSGIPIKYDSALGMSLNQPPTADAMCKAVIVKLAQVDAAKNGVNPYPYLE